MSDSTVLNYTINDLLELSLSFMPFINGGGLFIPTQESFNLGDGIIVNLLLPGKKENIKIEGKVIWITPSNALHHVLPGIGIQFTGSNATSLSEQVQMFLDKSLEVGGYTYGITGEIK